MVIPALDEAARIEACIACLAPLRTEGVEVVVSDGGSSDDTRERAVAAGARVVASPRGRARQQNAGAEAVAGDLLWFVHADCRPSPGACAMVAAAAATGEPVWGRFDVTLSGPGAMLRIIEVAMNARSRFTGIATGDQCLFVSRGLFRRAGGFPDIALMEDIALSRTLRRIARPRCERARVVTSSRKWREEGVWRTVALMWRLRLAYALGADPAGLARRYYRSR